MTQRNVSARGYTDDGSEFDGTTQGVDRVAPGPMTGQKRYILTSVVFRTVGGTISNLEIILWDAKLGARVGKIGGAALSEQTWGGKFVVPVDDDGNSNEVRVVTSDQSVHPAYLTIDGFVDTVLDG